MALRCQNQQNRKPKEGTDRRNAPNVADFNRASVSEFGQENNFRSRKLDGGTKSEVGRLVAARLNGMRSNDLLN